MRRQAMIRFQTALILGCLLAARILLAQDEPVAPENSVTAENVRGLVPYASYDGSSENVNLYNGSLQLQLPLFTLPGRAGHDLGVSALYTGGRVPFHERTRTRAGIEVTLCNRRPHEIAGPWELAIGPAAGGGGFAPHLDYEPGQFTRNSVALRRNQFVLTGLSGSEILFREISGKDEYQEHEWVLPERFRSSGGTYLSLQERDEDGDGDFDAIVLTAGGERIYFENIAQPNFTPSYLARSLSDTDGNRIDYGVAVPLTAEDAAYIQQAEAEGDSVAHTAVRDTLGRLVKLFVRSRLLRRCANGLFPCAAEGAQSFFFPVETVVKVRNSGGTWLEYRLTHSGFGDTDGLFRSDLVLPSGQRYVFDWATLGPFNWTCGANIQSFSDIRLVRVRYPNGGFTRYTWGSQGGTTVVVVRHRCSDSSGVCSSAEEETTTYDRGSLFHSSDTLVTLADGSSLRHHFQSFLTEEMGRLPLETTVETFGSDGELLHTRVKEWSPGRLNPRVVEEREILHRTGEERKTTFTYDQAGYLVDGFRETAGNVTLRRDFDWSVGGAGPLLRQTRTRYLIEDDSGYGVQSDVHLLRLPAWTEVLDATGQVVARNDFTYDAYAPGEPLPRSGAVQHTQPPTSRLGNLTSRTQKIFRAWGGGSGTTVQASSATATTRWKYDVLGNVVETVDPEGRSTVHSFADAWLDASCAPAGGSSFALPTSTTNPLGHQMTRRFHSCSSLLARVTDENANTTEFLYGVFDRLSETRSPDGGRENWYYSDSDLGALHRGLRVFTGNQALPTRVAHFTKIDDALDMEGLQILDGLGRISLEGERNGSRYDWTKTEYDERGRVFRRSNPITADKAFGGDGPSPTVFGNWTTTEYDALGRVVRVTGPHGSRTLRLYEGSETLITDPAGIEHLTRTDGLGHLVEVTEALGGVSPRSGPPGNFQADLALAVAAPAVALSGQQFIYQLTVTNDGPDTADELWITAGLPAGVTLLSISGSGWGACDPAGTQVTCPGTTSLAAGASRSLSLTVQVDTEAGDLAIAGQVRSDTASDPFDGDNTAGAVTTVQEPRADLAITKSAGASVVPTDSLLSYSLFVTNGGPDAATDLVVSDELPPEVIFTGFTGFGWTCFEDAGLLLCTRDTLASGTSAPLTVTVTTGSAAVVTNTATVVSTTFDPDLSDNTSAPVVTTVTADADLELTQTASATSVVGRKDVTLTLSLINHGPAAAENVRITGTLPEGVTFVGAGGAGFTCTEVNGVVTCDADGDLAVGIYTVDVDLQTPAIPVWLESAVSVSASSPDPNPGNDNPPPLEIEVYTLVPIRTGQPPILIPVHPDRP